MGQQLQPIEFNTFVKGLHTESGPLTSPKDTSKEEVNMVLYRDGSRNRRLGVDMESDSITVTGLDAAKYPPNLSDLSFNTFTWTNPAGVPGKTLNVIQIGKSMYVFNPSEILSSGLIYTYDFTSSSSILSFSSINGVLAVASGAKEIQFFTYDPLATSSPYISVSSDYLKIRDMFGVESIESGGSADLNTGQYISKRPSGKTDGHIYNLRNQSWAIPRLSHVDSNTVSDCISDFYAPPIDAPTSGTGVYPSNSDAIHPAMYAKPTISSGNNPLADRFNAADLVSNPVGSGRAPIGYFIIDAMERGASRTSNITSLYATHSELGHSISSLATDKTPGGPSVVGEYAGRAWWGGFSGEIEGGDNRSPNLSSYVMFSQLVYTAGDATQCFQKGDPTGTDLSEIVASDGGFIKISQAYDIKNLVAVGKSLFVLASNGVWEVSGADTEGFKATNYSVKRVTNQGVSSPKSVVVVDSTILFWGENGIFLISQNQYGDWVTENLIKETIQTYYDRISIVDKSNAHGVFDPTDHKIRWVYHTDITSSEPVKEVIFDTSLKAFYTNSIKSLSKDNCKIVGAVEVDSYVVDLSESKRDDLSTNIKYLTVLGSTSNILFSFSHYKDLGFLDWKSVNSVGVDATAYMITGNLPGSDFQREKQVPSLTCYLKRTENGFESISGVLTPKNPSSCLVQIRWNWTDDGISNEWTDDKEYYKYDRHYIPSGVTDTYNTGKSVITHKERISGIGKSFNIRFSSSPGKDLHLYGWSIIMGMNANV